jgi:hypothetical protein
MRLRALLLQYAHTIKDDADSFGGHPRFEWAKQEDGSLDIVYLDDEPATQTEPATEGGKLGSAEAPLQAASPAPNGAEQAALEAPHAAEEQPVKQVRRLLVPASNLRPTGNAAYPTNVQSSAYVHIAREGTFGLSCIRAGGGRPQQCRDPDGEGDGEGDR